MNVSVVVYPVMSVVPLWYFVNALNRIRRHWKDGRENWHSGYSATLMLKVALEVLIIVLACVRVYSVIVRGVEVLVFYGVFVLAWVTSLVMLNFEFLFKLKAKWKGHRMFVILSFFTWVVLIALNIAKAHPVFAKNLNTDFGLLVVCGFCNLCLMILCLWKPDEFVNNVQRLDRLLVRSAKYSFYHSKSMFGKLNVKIRDYKLKNVDGKSVLIYNICVKFGDDIHHVKKSYKDFEDLSNSIRASFPPKNFPNLNYPVLPRFSNPGITTDDKLDQLNIFLEKLCLVDFCNEDTLNFLQIKGYLYENLLREHLDIMENQDAFLTGESEDSGYIDLSVINFDNPLSESIKPKDSFCRYVEVSLRSRRIEKAQVEYIVCTFCTLGKREVVKKFKDFIDLHTTLKKHVGSLILPRFPKKSYFKLASKVDADSVEVRRRKLEIYLQHVLNDPVYHIEELFEFVGIFENFKELWRNGGDLYRLIDIEWETGVDEDEGIIFIISLEKVGEKSWQVRRVYKDFEYLHNFLKNRNTCNHLQIFYEYFSIEAAEIPQLPNKLESLTSNIEALRESLHNYMSELLNFTPNLEAHALIRFLNDTG